MKASSKKKIVVEEEKFNAVLGQLLKSKPMPMKKIKGNYILDSRKGVRYY